MHVSQLAPRLGSSPSKALLQHQPTTCLCREHGETLSKLEKKAALTLQMNFQVCRLPI